MQSLWIELPNRYRELLAKRPNKPGLLQLQSERLGKGAVLLNPGVNGKNLTKECSSLISRLNPWNLHIQSSVRTQVSWTIGSDISAWLRRPSSSAFSITGRFGYESIIGSVLYENAHQQQSVGQLAAIVMQAPRLDRRIIGQTNQLFLLSIRMWLSRTVTVI